MLKSFRRLAAFTLVEVLVVVVILGVLGAIVVPSLLTAGQLGIQGAARSVVADMLVAQNEAVAFQAERTVHFDLGNDRYGLFDQNDQVVQAAYLPELDASFDLNNNDITGAAGRGRNFIVDFRTSKSFQGVEIVAANFAGEPRVTFDALGSPIAGGFVDLRFGPRVFRVSVAPFTGRLTVDLQE